MCSAPYNDTGELAPTNATQRNPCALCLLCHPLTLLPNSLHLVGILYDPFLSPPLYDPFLSPPLYPLLSCCE
jgi:hypothetical protein